MRLPLELIDEIIGYMSLWYLRHRCSLVSKSWARFSQKRIFRNVDIHNRNVKKWLNTVSPTNAELLGHIRTLSYKEYATYPLKESELGRCALRDYFPSFRQLRYLALSSALFSLPPQQIKLFSAFQHTLSEISLSSCSTSKATFVTILNYFPNLANLYLRHFVHHHKQDEPTPPLSRTLFKKLCVAEWPSDSLDLLDDLSELGLQFEEVIISDSVLPGPTWSDFAKRVISAFGAGAKRLRLLDTPREMGRSSVFSHCRELCELELFALSLNDVELALASSITSTTIKKLILTHSTAFRLPTGHVYWTQLDDILTRLVKKLEDGLRLKVEFRDVAVTWNGKQDLGKYLPMFVRKGQMSVFDIKSRPIYCSDDAGERR